MKYFTGFHTLFLAVFILFAVQVYSQKFDNLALTPPMGWNSWNKFHCDGLNEKMVKEIADAMVSSGMKDAGYEYIVLDDCWQIARDPDGNIVPDPEKFPSGMKALGDYIHSKGLKFGIYSDAGRKTCQRRPGSWGYELQDAKKYAEWGVDYLKYDWCHTAGIKAKVAYPKMRDALFQAGRPIVFSMCEWGLSKPWKWAKDVGHLWRTTPDIVDQWGGTKKIVMLGWTKILDRQAGLEKYAGPGHWNDPDMLEVGNDGMTNEEYKAHFSLWCMLAAPLMAGNDIRNMTDSIRMILTNKEVIAINQDPLGMQGYKIRDDGSFEIWKKPLSNGDIAICFFNRSKSHFPLDVDWKFLSIDGSRFTIRDLWLHEEAGTTDFNFTTLLSARSVIVLRLIRNT